MAARKLGGKGGAGTVPNTVVDGYAALLAAVAQKTAPEVPIRRFFDRYASDLAALLDRGWTLESVYAETSAGLGEMPFAAYRRHAAAAVAAYLKARAPAVKNPPARSRGRPRNETLQPPVPVPVETPEMPVAALPIMPTEGTVETVTAPAMAAPAVEDYVGRTVEIVAIFDSEAPSVDGMRRDGNRLIAHGPGDRVEVARARLAGLGATEIMVNVVGADDVSRPF